MILILGAIIIASIVAIGWTDLRSGLRLLERGPGGSRRPPSDPSSHDAEGTRPTRQP